PVRAPSCTTRLPYTTLFRARQRKLEPQDRRADGRGDAPEAPHVRAGGRLVVLRRRLHGAAGGGRRADGHPADADARGFFRETRSDRKSTRLNSSHVKISYAV